MYTVNDKLSHEAIQQIPKQLGRIADQLQQINAAAVLQTEQLGKLNDEVQRVGDEQARAAEALTRLADDEEQLREDER